MGHLLGIPVKPSSSRLAFLLRATPCASLHHSLVLRNGLGSGGYNIFLKDSFSSTADHRQPVSSAFSSRNSSFVKHCSRPCFAWLLRQLFIPPDARLVIASSFVFITATCLACASLQAHCTPAMRRYCNFIPGGAARFRFARLLPRCLERPRLALGQRCF